MKVINLRHYLWLCLVLCSSSNYLAISSGQDVQTNSSGCLVEKLILSSSANCTVSTSDSLALVDLYDDLGGIFWDTQWDFDSPVATWNGVTVDENCKITRINLIENNLQGRIPNFRLPDVTFFLVGDDNIFGALPNFSNADNLILFQAIDCNIEDVPDLSNHPTLEKVLIYDNKLTFEDIIPNELLMHSFGGYETMQKLPAPAGATLAIGDSYTIALPDFDEDVTTNVYEWFRDTFSVGAGNGKSITLNHVTPADAGQYFLQVTNPNAPDLTLMSEAVPITIPAGPTTSVIVSEVFSNNTFTLKNVSATTIDMSSYYICNFPTYQPLNTLTVECGSLNLASGESVTLTSTNLYTVDDGELGLYNTNSFASSSALESYVEWGSTGHMRASVAISKGIWNGLPASSFSVAQSITLMGSGISGNDWVIDNTPTICPSSCMAILILNDTIPAGIYQTSDQIQSAGTVAAGSTVTFDAKNSITLNANFTVASGGMFLAKIGGCTATTLTESNIFEELRLVKNTTINTVVPNAVDLSLFPSPATSEVTLSYQLETPTETVITLHDQMGKILQVLLDSKEMIVGDHQLRFSATGLNSGLYFVVITTPQIRKSQKLMVVR